MTFLPLRTLTARPAAGLADAWLERLEHELASPDADRPAICRRTLAELAYPEYAANWETAVNDERVALGTRLALAALDPRNITLEPEYYADCDDAQFQRVKPLLWLWYSFDRLPIGDDADLTAVAAAAWTAVAEHALALGEHWTGNGKWLLREMRDLDQALADEWVAAHGNGDATGRLVRHVLDQHGGPLFDGHRADGERPGR